MSAIIGDFVLKSAFMAYAGFDIHLLWYSWLWHSLVMAYAGYGIRWLWHTLVMAFTGYGIRWLWHSLVMAYVGYGIRWLWHSLVMA